MTAAAIMLRLWLPLMLISGVPFATGYRIVAWLCWVPNLLVAEGIGRWRRRGEAGALRVEGAGLAVR